MNADGLPMFSANNWLAPALTYVFVSGYGAARPGRNQRAFAQTRLLAVLAGLIANVLDHLTARAARREDPDRCPPRLTAVNPPADTSPNVLGKMAVASSPSGRGTPRQAPALPC